MGSDSDDAEKQSDVLLFLFTGVLIGAGISHVLSRMGDPVPYTVCVFFIGLFMAVALNAKESEFYSWSDGASRYLNIDAELILYIFLPPLLFGEAMGLNWYHVKGAFAQATLLAGPGVLIGAYTMGAIVFGCFDFGWDFPLCMLFGGITAATDPVAVVALLNDLGASPKLTILVVGESLMNDGTGMVMFMLYVSILGGTTYTAGGIVGFFAYTIAVSPLVGCAVGGISILAMRMADRELLQRDVTFQIAISFSCAYLSFFFAQYNFEVSGVLSCCAAGLIFSKFGPPLILDHKTMHAVWGFVEWMYNTVVFLLAGLLYGDRALAEATGSDILRLILLYIALMLVRVFVVALLYPVLSRIGNYKVRPVDAAFIAYGGLRGALAITLSLIVVTSHEDLGISEKKANLLFFHVGGIAALTLLINATTSKFVMTYLGVIGGVSQDKLRVLRQIRKRIKATLSEFVHNAKLKNADLDVVEVKEMCSIFNNERFLSTGGAGQGGSNGPSAGAGASGNSGNLFPRFSKSSQEDSNHSAIMRRRSSGTLFNPADARKLSGADLTAYVRTIFLEIVRVRYWHDIETGKLPRLSHSARFLLYTVDVALEKVKSGGEEFGPGLVDLSEILSDCEEENYELTLLVWLDRITPQNFNFFRYLYGKREGRRQKRLVYMLTSFIAAHESAQKKIHSFVGADEGMLGVDGPSPDDVTPEEEAAITASRRAVALARKRLTAMRGDMVRGIMTKQIARAVLNKEDTLVKGMIREGLMTAEDGSTFFEELQDDYVRIHEARRQMYRSIYEVEGSRRREVPKESFKSPAKRRSLRLSASAMDAYQRDSLLLPGDPNIQEPLISLADELMQQEHDAESRSSSTSQA